MNEPRAIGLPRKPEKPTTFSRCPNLRVHVQVDDTSYKGLRRVCCFDAILTWSTCTRLQGFVTKHYFSMNCCSCLWDLVTLSNGWIWWLSSTAYLTQIFVTCLWSLFLKWSRYKNVAVTFSFRLHLISDKPPRWSFWHFRGIRAKLCALSKWRSQAGGEAGSRVKTNLYDALVNLV